MTTKEASKILCVVPASVARYCRTKEIKAVQVLHGRRAEWELKPEDVWAFKEKLLKGLK